jgi:ABC-type sugar transport system ATPase subunit
MNSNNVLLSCTGIDKRFPGVHALKNVDFSIRAGKVHGLVGANGAGKSTLFKILAGVYNQDSGDIYMNGRPYEIQNTQDAIDMGVVTIHQDINLIPTLSIAENILLNNEAEFKRAGFINNRQMNRHISEVLKEYQIEIDPRALVSSIPNDQKKLIQIIKAVNIRASVLLMDEPTSSLTETGIQFVHGLIKKLAARNVGIVFISHYLSEIFETCDYISVIRDGRLVADTEIDKTDMDAVVIHMLGKEMNISEKKYSDKTKLEKILTVRSLTIPGKIENVSFSIGKGEILGATGLIGSGLTELSKALFGFEMKRNQVGSIEIGDDRKIIRDTHDAVQNGMALLTNDRLKEGILPLFPLYENVCLPILERFKKNIGLLDIKQMIATGEKGIQKLGIKAKSPLETPRTLSGGNQQKVLVAKWLETNPLLFIMDEPTIGIDVGSKEEIRNIIKEIASQGVGVLLLTTEYEELELLCDRVIVMFRGKIIAEFSGKKINKDAIVHASAGGLRDD